MTGNGSAAPSTESIYDVIIIGSGPAGYTAAIYTSRANLRVLMLQGFESGGQLMITSDVENYPGFEEAILGPDLMDRFEAQARRFGTEMIAADVTRVDFSSRPFTVYTDEGAYRARQCHHCHRRQRQMAGPCPMSSGLQGRGVSGCATCDGPFFRNKEIAVVGGGDTAMEEALFLTKYASRVHLLHRRRLLPRQQDHAGSRAHQRKDHHSLQRRRRGRARREKVEGLVLRDLETGASETLPVQGFFVAIGHQPNTGIFKGSAGHGRGRLPEGPKHTMSSVPGCIHRRRRCRPSLPPGGNGRRRWLSRRHRCRALAGGPEGDQRVGHHRSRYLGYGGNHSES